MKELEIKKLIKETYPDMEFNDKFDYRIQKFSADDMIYFSELCTNKLSKYKRNFTILGIISRILVFPFFSITSLIGAFILWIKWVYNFGRYGGESIAYTAKMNRKTIQDVFEKLIKNN